MTELAAPFERLQGRYERKRIGASLASARPLAEPQLVRAHLFAPRFEDIVQASGRSTRAKPRQRALSAPASDVWSNGAERMRVGADQDLRIATAGWAIPRTVAEHFPSEGTGLARYAACFSAVEINSTFYRSHRASTYARWVATTPPDFRFAVKLPRAITHEARLASAAPLLAAFRSEAAQLGEKLGPLLMQLPPSLVFDPATTDRFLQDLRGLWPETVVCEPRHPSWFEDEADSLLSTHRIGRVAADPARHPVGATPGGWRGVSYWRLHGSPRTYHSPYSEPVLLSLAAQIKATIGQVWCVFDNTASGAAAADALRLRAMSS